MADLFTGPQIVRKTPDPRETFTTEGLVQPRFYMTIEGMTTGLNTDTNHEDTVPIWDLAYSLRHAFNKTIKGGQTVAETLHSPVRFAMEISTLLPSLENAWMGRNTIDEIYFATVLANNEDTSEEIFTYTFKTCRISAIEMHAASNRSMIEFIYDEYTSDISQKKVDGSDSGTNTATVKTSERTTEAG